MLKLVGQYFIFLGRMLFLKEKGRTYWQLIIDECINIGISSVFIVVIVSTFIGAVTAIQTAYNLVSPLIPKYVIGLLVRDTTILELAPTIISIILAGKVGSNIAGNLGTMRITEQIDALEVMGVNSVAYLVFPKVVAALFTFPLLVIMAGFLSMVGGYVAGVFTGVVSEYEYVRGLREQFVPYNITFALIKTVVFSFLITTISSFKGYHTRGGALEVGLSSTQAVTSSCIAILAADYLLAELLL